jgi:cyclopropane fatty-acyl-phospholipid synthase-like methyltransferase
MPVVFAEQVYAVQHYETYATYKAYTTPSVGPKHIKRFDREVWEPAEFKPEHAVLEIGCGTGLFLAYLHEKGIRNMIGIDQDAALRDIVPGDVRDAFVVDDAESFISSAVEQGTDFDRIALFDVLEHFDADAGRKLLADLKGLLRQGGRIIIKVPNAGSPWGQQFQYGDLTHKTAYTPESMKQQAIAAGFTCVKTYPHRLGSPARQRWERVLHGVLGRIVTSPPSIWEGNFYAVLAPA